MCSYIKSERFARVILLTCTVAPPHETDPCFPCSGASASQFDSAGGDSPPPGFPSADSAAKHHIDIEGFCQIDKNTGASTGSDSRSHYLALVADLGGSDVQLLEVLLELGEVDPQPGVLQLGLVQLTLQLLVINCQQLVVTEQLLVILFQP